MTDVEVAVRDELPREPWLGTWVRSYPDRVPTLVAALDRAVRRFPDHVALETPEAVVTYTEFADLVEGAVSTLLGLGFRTGDRLVVALPNGLDAAVAIWACARAGLIFVGLSTRLQPTQWAYMLEHSAPRRAVAAPEHLAGLREAGMLAGLPAAAVTPVGGLLTGTRRPWLGDHPDRPFPDQDTVYGIVYTSGTTGRPKASQLVHRATMHSAIAYIRILNLIEGDRTAVVFPMYYVTAHVAQITPMMLVGGTSVAVREFSARDFVALLRDHGITYLMVVPSIWGLLLRCDGFRWPDLDHVRIGAFGGSPVPLSTIEALRARMPQLRLYDAYGLTETHSPATCLVDAEFRRKPGSVGRPVPCAEVRVVDESGADLPTGEAGELWVRGPMITPGYYGDPDATAQAITDGWLHTGDLARLDDEGYVYILDRMKDMIMRGGNKIYSVELEYVLVSHPAIAEAAVVGIPDQLAYEAVAAYVVPAPGATVDPVEVRRWVAHRLADYAVPKLVRVVEAIPRNRTGKIDKIGLRAELIAHRAESA